MDRINIFYDGDSLIEKSINEYYDFIVKETLADNIIKCTSDLEMFNLNDHETGIKVEKI